MRDLYYRYTNSNDVPNIIKDYIYFSVDTLLRKNPGLKEKVEELQETYDKVALETNRIESEQEIQGTGDDKA